jgi:Fic family protein
MGDHGRGARLTAGEFRSCQVWIGGARPGNAVFVPPANELDECLRLFERFLHDLPETTSPPVKAALAHVQFEPIHPFLDGNGRLGRLLIALQLSADALMREPMLYLSLQFKEHRQTYYELLNSVRLTGDWETWLEFFADAALASSTQAATSARRLLQLAAADGQRIAARGRATASALAIHQALQRQPIATAASLAATTGLTPATVNKALVHLERLGVVAERTRKLRGRVFSYARYAEILNEGMALPGSGR